MRLFVLAATFSLLEIPAVAGGQDSFLKNCASCHGKDGKGKTPIGRKLGAKDLAASKTTRAEIEKQISEGMRDQGGVVKMPGFAGKLSADEIRELTDYTMSLRK